MSAHEYTPREALDLLLRKVEDRDDDLAEQVRIAVDAGKDVEEEEEAGIRKRRRRHRYRKAAPYTDEEALRVALDVLQAYFVEQPLFLSSALDDFRTAAIGETQHLSWRERGRARGIEHTSEGEEKGLEVEPHSETQISRHNDEMLRLNRIDAESVEEQKRNLDALRHLFDFTGD